MILYFKKTIFRLEESDDLKVKIYLATWFFKRLNIKKTDVLIFNRSYLLLLGERSGPLFPSFNIYAKWSWNWYGCSEMGGIM